MKTALAAATAVLVAAVPAAAQTTTFGNEDGALRQPEALAVEPDGTVLVGDHASGRIQPFRAGRPVAGAFGLSGETCGRLGAVSGVARAADGRVFVLDSDNQRVHVFDAQRRPVRCFGRRGVGRGELRTSSGAYAASTASGGIAVSGSHVFVADTGNDRVQRFTLDGRDAKVIGKGRLDDPQGLAVRGARLLVADDRNHRVAEFTTGGRFVRAGKAGLRFPYDVALAPDGRAFVADNNGHRVVVLDRRLRPLRSWGRFGRGRGALIFPRAIALTPGGTVLVADPGNDRVTEFTATGRYVRTLGTNGRRDGMVSTPADVAVNAHGEVAVADHNMRISWFDLDGRYRGRWAQGRSFRASTAVVTSPRSLAFAAPGLLRVAEAGTIRELGAGLARDLLDLGGPGSSVRAVEVAPDGKTWVLGGRGRVAPLTGGALGPEIGPPDPRDRTNTALAALSDGSIAVAQGGAENRASPADGVVVRIDQGGRVLSTWTLSRGPGDEPTKPAGLAADGAGGVWVSDAANHRVLHLGAQGQVLAVRDGSDLPVPLARPAGLALDCAGGLLVADRGNNRVVRFGGVQAPTGCAAPPSPPTASARLPKPVGVRLRVRERAKRPAGRLATVAVLCERSCRVAATASTTAFGDGRLPRSVPLRATVSGRRIAVTASGEAIRAMRSAIRSRGGSATVGVTVTATAPDGVVDTAATTLTFR